MRRWISIAILGGFAAPSLAPSARPAEPPASRAADEGLARLADSYFSQVYFKYSPTAGTEAGFHQYDTQLEDYSRTGVDRQLQALAVFEKKFAAIQPRSLGITAQGDLEMLLGNIRSTRLTLSVIRPWEKNPDTYSSGVAASAFSIMERAFAPPDDRLRALIARERRMPAVFDDARRNLRNPPRIFTEIALEQLPGNIAFFQKDLPAAFVQARDPQVKAEFARANAAVIAALESYRQWLQSDLLPRSHGDFRIGAETFHRKLEYDEMVDMPLPRLLRIGYADLRKNQAEFARIARQIDPGKPPSQILQELAQDHPAPGQLLQSFRDTFNGLILFIEQRHIVEIPSQVRPILEETPPFMRATTVASMDTPGPFETVAKEAYFNVTLPGPKDSPQAVEERMEEFNRGTIISTSVHEAYPGHYIQFLWTPYAPSTVRKLLGASSNAEGWAHYCEQMMLDEGFGQPGTGARDARDAKMIRLGQLQDALLRDARFVVGIRLHTGRFTFDQAVDFFVREGYQTRESAMTETKRGASDPTYLYYTLGKLEILKLRADLMRKEGPSFSLEKFHDDFLKQGYPPIPIVRRALLGNNSPAL